MMKKNLIYRVSMASFSAMLTASCSLADIAPKDPIKGCEVLAGSPIEGGVNKFGEPLGRTLTEIVAPAAVKACEEAVRENPSDAASWRRLAKAYHAGILYHGFDKDRYQKLYFDAIFKSGESGDYQSLVTGTIYNPGRTFTRDEVIDLARRLINNTNKFPDEKLENKFYRLIMKAHLARIEAKELSKNIQGSSYEKGVEEKDILRKKFISIMDDFKSTIAIHGGERIYKELLDIRIMGMCDSYLSICAPGIEAINESNNPGLFLKISADRLEQGYRNAEAMFDYHARDGANYEKMSIIEVAARGNASEADMYINYAEKVGDVRYDSAIRDARSAVGNYRDYLKKRRERADGEVEQARKETWAAIGAVAVGIIALSSQSGGSGLSFDDVSKQREEDQRKRQCEQNSYLRVFGTGTVTDAYLYQMQYC